MNTRNRYGYKVCYRELGNSKLKLYLVSNTLDLAIWSVRWYEIHKVSHPTLHIFEVRTLKEYNRLWKGCPFKENLDINRSEKCN